MSYRPITDVWILARPKVRYYGAYPSGFLERARALLGVRIDEPVLHVCAGKVREYPFRGFGPNDVTMDMDRGTLPDIVADARQPFPTGLNLAVDGSKLLPLVPVWAGILMDPPYTEADAAKYQPGAAVLPSPRLMLRNALDALPVGRRVGILHYVLPRPPVYGRFVAAVGVIVGYDNRIRIYSVFEKVNV